MHLKLQKRSIHLLAVEFPPPPLLLLRLFFRRSALLALFLLLVLAARRLVRLHDLHVFVQAREEVSVIARVRVVRIAFLQCLQRILYGLRLLANARPHRACSSDGLHRIWCTWLRRELTVSQPSETADDNCSTNGDLPMLGRPRLGRGRLRGRGRRRRAGGRLLQRQLLLLLLLSHPWLGQGRSSDRRCACGLGRDFVLFLLGLHGTQGSRQYGGNFGA
mmetsp:Transcript_12945/g.36229  ORF Transcript_12945/g.36229 Transcript_12945/m.36229 type:complete len:219 (+) Transcript_12945:959-1615(+)